VQTFVPLPDYAESAKALDSKRLFKQLLECVQLLAIILELPKDDGSKRRGWQKHPATLQWRPWPGSLLAYSRAIADECRTRGLNTTNLVARLNRMPCVPSDVKPIWWGDEAVHSSHRARLLQKDFEHYSKHGWPEADDPRLAERVYEWPIPTDDAAGYRLEHR
jgi:hypothetical protein